MVRGGALGLRLTWRAPRSGPVLTTTAAGGGVYLLPAVVQVALGGCAEAASVRAEDAYLRKRRVPLGRRKTGRSKGRGNTRNM